MSLISALSSQSGAQPPSNSFDAQIKLLEKRVDAGVKNGTITSDQADQITKALDAVQHSIDQAGGEDTLPPADKGDIRKLLRDIAKAVAGAPQEAGEKGAVDHDGDGDDIGFSTIA